MDIIKRLWEALVCAFWVSMACFLRFALPLRLCNALSAQVDVVYVACTVMWFMPPLLH